MEMHERIKYLRKNELNMTQEEFALKINISRSNLGSIEIGRINVTDRVINDICDSFNVSEDWIKNEMGKPFVDLNRDEEIADFVGTVLSKETDNFQKRFIAMLSKLNVSDWETIEKMLSIMNEKIKED